MNRIIVELLIELNKTHNKIEFRATIRFDHPKKYMKTSIVRSK